MSCTNFLPLIRALTTGFRKMILSLRMRVRGFYFCGKCKLQPGDHSALTGHTKIAALVTTEERTGPREGSVGALPSIDETEPPCAGTAA